MISCKSLSLAALTLLFCLPLQAGGILVTGDIRGEIKPCGCSAEGDLGGIERASTFLKSKKGATWVDLGNFSAPATPQGELKTTLLVKHFKTNGLRVILPGPLEFQTGLAGFARQRLPYVLSNSQTPIPGIQDSVVAGGLVWLGYLSPQSLYQGAGAQVTLDGIEAFARQLPPKVPHRALLFRGSLDELKQLLQTHSFSLVLLANSAEEEAKQTLELSLEGKTYYSPPLKGQGLWELADTDKPGKLYWLDKALANDPAMQKDFAAYDKKVEAMFMALLAGSKAQEKRVYKGAEACVSCHKKEGEAWKQSRHAQALASLKRVGKQFDPECITCHVQGFGQGGYREEAETPDLAHVGCENCHGPYQPHEKGWPNRVKADESTCKICHQGNHSPKFQYNVYYPKIAHER